MTPEAQLAFVENIPAYLGAIFAGVAMILGIVNQNRLRRTNYAVTEVKQTAVATHLLVNSTASAALLAVLTQAQRIADLTNNPHDIQNVLTAQHAYDEHLKQQEIVNANATPTPPIGKL